MSIPLTCSQGHAFGAPDHLLGQSVRCPSCQEIVLVEMPVDLVEAVNVDVEGDVDIEVEGDPLDDLLDMPLPQASPIASSWQAPTRTIEVRPHLFETTQGKLAIVGGGLVAGALLGFLLLGVISLFRGGSASWSSSGGGLAGGDANGNGYAETESQVSMGNAKPNDPIVRKTVQKLQSVSLGMMMYEDKMRRFPPGNSKQSGLSWRVHILPFINQKELYGKFKLDEAWDSPSNLPLVKEMPDAYKLGDDSTKTRIQIISNDETWYQGDKPPRLADLTDGLNSTITVIAVGTDRAVEWTCPDDFVLDKAQPVASLGKLPGDVIVFSTATDVVGIGTQVDPKVFLAMVTHKGGEIVDPLCVMQDTLHLSPDEFRTGYIPFANKPPLSGSGKPIVPAGGKFTLQQQVQAAANGLLSHQAQFKHLSMPSGSKSGALSWRVHILPYMGHMELYSQFNFSEPWDGPNNSKLLSKIPSCYDTGNGNKTRIQGLEALLGMNGLCSLSRVQNSPDCAILTMAVPSALAIPWTEPDELGKNPDAISKLVSAMGNESLPIVTCDGRPLQLNAQQARDSLPAMARVDRKEQLDMDSLRKVVGVDIPIDKMLADRIRYQVLKDQERASRMKAVIEAMHNYESAFKSLPPSKSAPTLSKDGKTERLSWRVLLLPYLQQNNLYQQFKLDEPWDSPNNKALIDKMPAVFADPEMHSTSISCIVKVTGPGTLFSRTNGPKFSDASDGGRTIAIIHITPDPSQPWTKPGDLQLDATAPAPLQKWPRHHYMVGLLDGSIRTIKTTIPKNELSALLTASGNEIPPSWTTAYGTP